MRVNLYIINSSLLLDHGDGVGDRHGVSQVVWYNCILMDLSYHLQILRLSFLRNVSSSTPLKLAKSSTNPYLNAAGLTDIERWPEIDHTPRSPTFNYTSTPAQSSKSSGLLKAEDAPPTRGSSLQYTQTIVGPGRSLALSMRTNARLSQDVNRRRRLPAADQRQQYLKTEKSDVDSSHDEPPSVVVQEEDNEESDTDNMHTLQSDEDDDDYVVDYDSQLARNGTSPSSASFIVNSQANSQVPNTSTVLNDNNQTLSSTDNIPPLQVRNTHSALETRPRGASTSTADADDEDDFRQQQMPRITPKIPDEQGGKVGASSPPVSVAPPPHSPLALAVHNNTARLLDSKRPMTMTRGNSLSAVEELNQETQHTPAVANDTQQSSQSAVVNRFRSASVSTSAARDIDDRKVDPRIVQKVDKEKEKELNRVNLLKKRPLQAPQQGTSALSKLIQTKSEAQKASKNGKSTSQNPFRRLYAAMDASEIGSSVNLSLYFPHSSRPKEPIRVQIRKDSTCEEVIGFGLYLFVEQREKDIKDMLGSSNDNVKWTPEGWNLRIVEEDGEVDEDFPGA